MRSLKTIQSPNALVDLERFNRQLELFSNRRLGSRTYAQWVALLAQKAGEPPESDLSSNTAVDGSDGSLVETFIPTAANPSEAFNLYGIIQEVDSYIASNWWVRTFNWLFNLNYINQKIEFLCYYRAETILKELNQAVGLVSLSIRESLQPELQVLVRLSPYFSFFSRMKSLGFGLIRCLNPSELPVPPSLSRSEEAAAATQASEITLASAGYVPPPLADGISPARPSAELGALGVLPEISPASFIPPLAGPVHLPEDSDKDSDAKDSDTLDDFLRRGSAADEASRSVDSAEAAPVPASALPASETRMDSSPLTKLKEEDCYALLGVDPSADLKELCRAYKRRSLVDHPDKGGSEEAFHQLRKAFHKAKVFAGDPEAIAEAMKEAGWDDAEIEKELAFHIRMQEGIDRLTEAQAKSRTLLELHEIDTKEATLAAASATAAAASATVDAASATVDAASAKADAASATVDAASARAASSSALAKSSSALAKSEAALATAEAALARVGKTDKWLQRGIKFLEKKYGVTLPSDEEEVVSVSVGAPAPASDAPRGGSPRLFSDAARATASSELAILGPAAAVSSESSRAPSV